MCGTGVRWAVCRFLAQQISWEAVFGFQARISNGDEWKSTADVVSSEWNRAACLWQHGLYLIIKLMFHKVIYTMSQKTCHHTFVHNFDKYWQILKFLPLAHSVENCSKQIIPLHLNCITTLPCETLIIAAVNSCRQQIFGHFRKFRPRSQQMISTTLTDSVRPVSRVEPCVCGWSS